MSITTKQIDLVKGSFQTVKPISKQAAVLFYNRLFEIAPHTRALFKSADMDVQGEKLMQLIAVAVRWLEQPEYLVTVVKILGARHTKYGVKTEDYAVVGEALLWTLEQGLGDAFTEEVKEAWTAVYGLLAETAIAGMEEWVNVKDS